MTEQRSSTLDQVADTFQLSEVEQRALRIIIDALDTVESEIQAKASREKRDGRRRLMDAADEFFNLGATKLEWSKAKKHLDEMKDGYVSLLNTPGVNPCFGLGAIMEIESRYDGGERTELLFQAMMSVE